MKTMKFHIWRVAKNMCRITSSDVRDDVRKLTDGACICDMECLMDEMARITKAAKERFDSEAVFEIVLE